jgi:predicted amidophosphoribosyltransferase
MKDCLYCGLQFPDTTHFCSNCGRPTESGFKIRAIHASELERLRRELKEKEEQIRLIKKTVPLDRENSALKSPGER